ncbi:MAG: efflux RND transporter permease subunit [Candidatus Krumholzibacteriia bacterium]
MFNRMLAFSLGNRGLVVLAALALMVAGWAAWQRLPVDAFPDVSPNLVQVFTVTEGLAPEEVETFVTFPVETAMGGLPGVTAVRSVSNFGLSVVSVYFEDGMDIYFARQLVGERLQEARDHIPAGFGEPQMGPISTGMGLVLYYYLDDTTGTYDLTELRAIQDWLIKTQLQTVPGVTEVLGIGGYEKQYQVVVDPDALLRFGVSLDQVIDSIEANNLNVGAQFIEKNHEEFVVRSLGLASGLEDLESIVLKTVHGRPVFLADVARVTTGGAIRRGVQTRNGVGEVVAGMVVKLFGSNSSTVIRSVEEKLDQINRTLPAGVRLVPYYEQKSIVAAAVATVTGALVQGVVLVVLVLVLFMGGWRPALAVIVSLPFSILFAMIVLWRLGISANLMSLGGLAIAIGMMVDGTIVMIENLERRLRAGPADGSRAAVLAAAGEVARPVFFSVAIVVAVFVPLMTLSGVEGKTFRPLAIAVAASMAGSLVFALTLAPLLGDVLLKRGGGASGRDPLLVRTLLAVYRPAGRVLVARPVFALILAGAVLAAGVLVYPRLGSEFTPRLQEGTVLVELTRAPSISLEESVRTNLIVERRLLEVPEVREVVSRIGRGEVGAHAHPVNSGEILVLLHSRDRWRRGLDQAAIEDSIRAKLGNVPGARYRLSQPIEITVDELLEGVRSQLAVKLFGEDLQVLRESADDIAAVLEGVPGAVDVQVDQVSGAPQLQIALDRQSLARYGVNVADVQQLIHAAVGGEEVGNIYEGIRKVPILVRFREDARHSAAAIGALVVTAPDGALVPLAELATIEEVVGSRQIMRENNQRFIAVNCNVSGRDIGGFVAEARERLEQEVQLPAGYWTEWAGQFKLQQRANARFMVVVPVTLAAITLMLVTGLGSWRSSLLIMLNIPLALVGGLVGLYLAGLNLSVPASVGFIALFGIALGNGMVFVTRADQLRAEGRTPGEAALEGACSRLRPVLMTAVTTALGLLPLLFAAGTGSEVQRPLAVVVTGGLVSSTLLTLLVLPALMPWFAAGRSAGGDQSGGSAGATASM